MKKIIYLLLFAFLITRLISCTPETFANIKDPKSCCGDEVKLPPSPWDDD